MKINQNVRNIRRRRKNVNGYSSSSGSITDNQNNNNKRKNSSLNDVIINNNKKYNNNTNDIEQKVKDEYTSNIMIKFDLYKLFNIIFRIKKQIILKLLKEKLRKASMKM
jgi:hypothetical protein